MYVQSPPGSETQTVKGKGKNAQSSIIKALKEGMPSLGVKDDSLLFIVAPDDFEWGLGGSEASTLQEEAIEGAGKRHSRSSSNLTGHGARAGPGPVLLGDVFVVKSESLDDAVWKMGGAAVGLRLVQLASVCFFLFCLSFYWGSLTFIIYSTRLRTSFLGLLEFLLMASRTVGRIRRIWNDYVRSCRQATSQSVL